jgi:hypothetical protein
MKLNVGEGLQPSRFLQIPSTNDQMTKMKKINRNMLWVGNADLRSLRKKDSYFIVYDIGILVCGRVQNAAPTLPFFFIFIRHAFPQRGHTNQIRQNRRMICIAALRVQQ